MSEVGGDVQAQSYVGFDSEFEVYHLEWDDEVADCQLGQCGIAITRQIEHKLLKRGFQFNVMVVGKLQSPESHCYRPHHTISTNR
jgi:hypothetical protein